MNKNIVSFLSLISLSLLFCLPFMVAYHRWPEANYYNQALAFLLGAVAVLVFVSRHDKVFSIPITIIVPGGLSLLITLQWIIGMGFYWQEAALGVIYLLWAAMLMLIAVRLKTVFGLEIIVRWLAYALLFGGVFNVIVVFMQLIGADSFFWTFPQIAKSYTGNLAQVNLLTDYLSLSLVSLIYLFITKRIKRNLVCFLIVFILIALTLTGSRMSWLYVLLIAVSLFYFCSKSELSTWRHWSKAMLLLPVLYGVIQFAFPSLVDVFASNAAIPPVPAERVVALTGGQSIRLDMLKQSLDIFSDYPLLGIGWGQYPWYDLLMADTYVDHKGFVMHSHNLFTQMLAECGVMAGILLLIGSIYWFVNILRQQVSVEKWWILLVAGIIFIHSMLEYPLWYAHFLGVFIVVVSLGDQCITFPLVKPAFTKAASALVFLGAISLIGITTYQYTQIEYWVNHYSALTKQQRFAMLNDMTAMHQKTLIAEPLHLVLTRAYSLLPRNQAPLKSKVARYETIMHYVQAKQDLYRYVLLLAADQRINEAKVFLARAYTRQPGYAKQFEKQLAKGVARGSEVHIALHRELKQLQYQQ